MFSHYKYLDLVVRFKWIHIPNILKSIFQLEKEKEEAKEKSEAEEESDEVEEGSKDEESAVDLEKSAATWV